MSMSTIGSIGSITQASHPAGATMSRAIKHSPRLDIRVEYGGDSTHGFYLQLFDKHLQTCPENHHPVHVDEALARRFGGTGLYFAAHTKLSNDAQLLVSLSTMVHLWRWYGISEEKILALVKAEEGQEGGELGVKWAARKRSMSV